MKYQELVRKCYVLYFEPVKLRNWTDYRCSRQVKLSKTKEFRCK